MAEPSAPSVRSFDDEALPHLDALYRVALRLTGDPAQAEDLVQDTMLKAYRSWRQYRPGTNAQGVAPHHPPEHLHQLLPAAEAGAGGDGLEAIEPHALYRAVATADPEGSFFGQLVDEKVLEAVDALPPEFREVLVLSDVEGLRYAEIAEALQVPVGTVKSRLFEPAGCCRPGSTPTRWRWATSSRGKARMGETIDCREARNGSPTT